MPSEPKHNSGGKPEIVLCAAKKAGMNFVALQSPGHALDEFVV
jgi:hypothetical protein